jgi:hypothetical protein
VPRLRCNSGWLMPTETLLRGVRAPGPSSYRRAMADSIQFAEEATVIIKPR